MKKPLSLISTLSILAASFALPVLPTYATIKQDGNELWSVQEMMALDTEVEDILNGVCNSEAGECTPEGEQQRQELYADLTSEPGKYAALNGFRARRFMITSVGLNKDGEYLKVLYRNTDPNKDTAGLREYIGDMQELYIVWAEDEESNPYYGPRAADNSPAYVALLREYGISSFDNKIHQTVSMSDVRNGAGWYGTPNTEQYYFVLGSELFYDEFRTIHYFFYVSEDDQLTDFVDYSSCTAGLAADELDGIECRLMFAADSTASYFPFRDGVMLYADSEPVDDGTNTNPDDGSTGTDPTNGDSGNSGDGTDGSGDSGDGLGGDGNSNASDGTNVDDTNNINPDGDFLGCGEEIELPSNSAPKTPNTGSSSTNNLDGAENGFRPKTAELLITIVALGSTLTVWRLAKALKS